MIDLITGHQGVAHISADQIASINNAMMDNYGANKVMRLVGGELTADGLTITISEGFWRVNGFDMEIQEGETLYIDPTTIGLSRIDDIYVEILQDIPTGAQRAEIYIALGEPSATPTAPDEPTAPYLNTDILLQIIKLARVTVSEGAMIMEDYSVAYNIVTPEDLAEVQTEVADIVNVYGAKNFISIDIEKTRVSNTTGAWSGNSYVISGITFIINADGTVTADGTASANVGLYLIPRGRKALTLPVGDYRITSTPSGGSNAKYFTELTYTDSNNAGQCIGYEYGSGYNFSITSSMISNYFDIGINLYVMNGQTVSNMLFKPMICCASIQDDTYVPYVPTNKDLVSCKLNGYVGAKNLLPYPYSYTTRTENGVTWTDNRDGTITINGTATSTAFFVLYNNASNTSDCVFEKNTTYRMSFELKNTSDMSIYVNVNGSDIAGIRNKSTGYYEVTFTTPSSYTTRFAVGLYVGSGFTNTNAIIKPMIRRVEDTDSTYQPYAMTNKELTDAFTNQVANSDDAYSPSKAYSVGDYVIYNNKVYKCITACSAGSWTVNQSNFEEDTLIGAVTDLNSSLSNKVGFIDYSKVLKAEQYLVSALTYTASEDCVAYVMVRKELNSAPTVNNVSLKFSYGIYLETYTIPLKIGDVLYVPSSSAYNSSIKVYAVR